jgi:hypothetical protein
MRGLRGGVLLKMTSWAYPGRGEANVVRIFLLSSISLLVAGCAATPNVTRERMTLGEANIDGMKCRREASGASSIPKTICASPALWDRYDKSEAEKSDVFLDDVRETTDNRRLDRNPSPWN